MTLKQQIHDLVDDLSDDSPLLVKICKTLLLNRSLGEALEDEREGRTYSEEEFVAKVQTRWPLRASP